MFRLVVDLCLHPLIQVGFELGVLLEDFLRPVLQGQGPQDGDAGVHHVDLTERVNVHLKEMKLLVELRLALGHVPGTTMAGRSLDRRTLCHTPTT